MNTLEFNSSVNLQDLIDLTNNGQEKLNHWKETLHSLERLYSDSSESANAACDYTRILAIVNKIQEFTENRQFYQLNNAIDHALFEIEQFTQNHTNLEYRLNKDILDPLRYGIEQLGQSFQFLHNSLKALINIGEDDSSGDLDHLKGLAENLERFGDILEDTIRFFGLDSLESVQSLMSIFIEQTQKKSAKLDSEPEAYRIRIRNAAGFIMRLIDFILEESEQEDQEILYAISSTNSPDFYE